MNFSGDHFSKQAAAYSVYRPQYPAELFSYLASLTQQHEQAWDCATGSGQAAAGLAPFYKNIIATDASAEQINNALAIDNVQFMVSPAETTPFKDHQFDLVTVAQALHWFDHDRFYNEVKRVVKPGGIFAAWCYSLFSINDEIDARVTHFYRDTVDAYWPEERHYIDEGYTTLPFPFEEIAPPPLSMSLHWNLPQVVGYLGTWSAVRYYREQQQHDPVPELYEQLKPHWSDEAEPRRVKWPIYLKVGRV